MSQKKKDKRNDEKLCKIYDDEPPTPAFFNEKRSNPKPFKSEGGLWYCGNDGCMVENAALFSLGDGLHKCGHCYREFNL